MQQYKIISCAIFDPTKSIFKMSKNTKAKCTIIKCCIEKCPLRELGFCTYISTFGWNACPYGKHERLEGYSRRASKFYNWITEIKKKYSDIPLLNSAPTKIFFIGDYVYLPYAHMDMNESVPFISHGGAFRKGCAFISKSSWNKETLLSLINFKPQAVFGGEILTYQKEVIPKFISHLKEIKDKVFLELIKEKPKFNKEINYIGRKALLKTLNYPIEWDADEIHWKWDGKKLYTNSKKAYSSLYAGISMESIEIIGVPKENETIKIQENLWINDKTIFLD